MLFKFTFLSNLFLAFMALAPSQLGTRLARGEDLQSQPSNQSVSPVDVAFYRDTTYNTNSAGAACIAQPGINFDIITGTFKVPTFSPTIIGGAFVWVGIGHEDCGPILIAGMKFTIIGSLVLYYAAFMLTSAAVEYQLIINPTFPGDEIRLTVFAGNVLGGMMVVENRTPGRVWVFRQRYSSFKAICDTTAQWVVQNSLSEDGTLYVSLANFHTITFYDTVASGPGSIPCIPSENSLLDILRGGTRLTESSVDGTSLNVRYLSSG